MMRVTGVMNGFDGGVLGAPDADDDAGHGDDDEHLEQTGAPIELGSDHVDRSG